MPALFQPAVQPTMYFIGVSTRQSSINPVFPRWAERLGLGRCELRGLDFPLNAAPDQYRAAVDFIRADPLTRGALVTSHKVALWRACREQFDAIDPLADALGEISSIYKRAGRLLGRSVDPWTVGDALAAFLPAGHWQNGAEVLLLGAGGAGTALAWHLCQANTRETEAAASEGPAPSGPCTRPVLAVNDGRHGGRPSVQQDPMSAAARPRCIHALDTQAGRLRHLRELHGSWPNAIPLACHLADRPAAADAVLAALPPGSLVVNATGLGKDAPGSPLGDGAVFPERGLVWDFNYRGRLLFLEQARAQQVQRRLQVEDGWVYFVHGWLRVMADVFELEPAARGPLFDELAAIAAAGR